jgi:hypothetical protein
LKKISAILLLAILLFYTAGYRMLFSIMENNASAKLEKQINSGKYNEDELVEVRIPLSMPYYSDKEFESVSGETDWNGNHYQYVKRKVEGNTLVLLCLPNFEKNTIAAVENDLTKNLSDLSTSTPAGQKQAPATIKIKLSDFDSYTVDFSLNQLTAAKQEHSIANDRMNTLFTPLTPAQPPETI